MGSEKWKGIGERIEGLNCWSMDGGGLVWPDLESHLSSSFAVARVGILEPRGRDSCL